MYLHQSFLSRGAWPSALQHPHLNTYHTDSSQVSPTSPLSRYTYRTNQGPPTPPEDMNSLAPSYQYSSMHQELGNYYADKNSSRRGYGQPYDSAAELKFGQSSGNQYPQAQQSLSRQSSPAHSHRSFASSSSQPARTGSQASLIAPSLQIPRTINNSQGSLSDLAAQITCLFWFESSALLDFAEDPASAPIMPQPLNPDAIPSTGFRKFVTTILSTTQVAQNVVLLALLFIYRLKRQNPTVKGKLGSEYRLLTVALMLGNKFLDDNTYTNKTWADVSGISVSEVHIMEVEFLSNMKYHLFTTATQWANWQAQLGRFARFIERAAQSPPQVASSLPHPTMGYNHSTLPSPPSSFQASPPRAPTPMAGSQYYPTLPPSHLPTARPSPMAHAPNLAPHKRKRSFEDDELMTAAKRVMQPQPQPSQTRPHSSFHTADIFRPFENSSHSVSYSNASAQAPPSTAPAAVYQPPRESHVSTQLPPLSQQLGQVVSGPSVGWQHTPASLGPAPSSMAAALRSAQTSRHHSPYLSSANVSPTNTSFLPSSLPQQNHQSPSFFLRQRDSPYKPVRGVHTLLVPPPSRALHHPEHVGNNQMHYQPLGRPNETQQGRLPYITQNQWYDPTQQRASAPVDHWPSFLFQNTANSQRLPVPQNH